MKRTNNANQGSRHRKERYKEKHYLLQYNNYSPPWFLHRSIQIFHWSKQAVNNFWTHIHGLRCRFICHSYTVSNLLLFVALKKSHVAILCLIKILLTNTAVWPGILTNNNDFFITTNSVITRIFNRRFFRINSSTFSMFAFVLDYDVFLDVVRLGSLLVPLFPKKKLK